MTPTYDRHGVQIWCGDVLDVLRELPSESVHCCVSSPPYYGLRDYGCEGQIGLEKTPQEFIAKLVAVFEEVRRVLRKDGTCWVNMGDSYAASGPTGHGGWDGNNKNPDGTPRKSRQSGTRWMTTGTARDGLKPKDRMMMPARLAIALCDAGWYLRDEIVWAKPSPMPESVTDRCTKAHEMIYMLTRSPKYFYDREAIAEPCVEANDARPRMGQGPNTQYKQKRRTMKMPDGWATHEGGHGSVHQEGREKGTPDNAEIPTTRTKRSVWTVTSEPFPAAHFATYPTKLIEPCILAGCPETCCAACGAPWVRVVEVEQIAKCRNVSPKKYGGGEDGQVAGKWTAQTAEQTRRSVTTLGFAPTCTCDAGTVPGLCLDPFLGSGTTAQVARDLGRRCWGIELNPEYVREHCTKRLEQGVLF